MFKFGDNSYSLNIDEERKIYIDEDQYKISIVEIKDDDNINTNSFLEFENFENLTPDKIKILQ